MTYLRYQFKQINDRIYSSIHYKNEQKLYKSLIDHNYCCMKTSQLNQTFSYLIVVMYIFAKPALNILVYITHSKGTHHYTRVAATNIFIVCLAAIFSVNFLCASVTSCAHKPLKQFYDLYKRDGISIRLKLKVVAFMEKLSGPDIGFYCYDLYPMNNNQFYRYVCGWAYNYFLIINLLKDMSLDF